jgi:RNA polymerase sigma-70 factor (ECF subfamily)
MSRYCGAVYRYLLGAVRDEEAALELFQEFALRFMRGDFRRADPERGRFRDYVKTSLMHLVTDYQREQQARARPLPPDLPAKPVKGSNPATSEDEFMTSWREELVNRTWQALADSQPILHAVLLMRVQNPDLQSRELADLLTTRTGKEVTAGNVRVNIARRLAASEPAA